MTKTSNWDWACPIISMATLLTDDNNAAVRERVEQSHGLPSHGHSLFCLFYSPVTSTVKANAKAEPLPQPATPHSVPGIVCIDPWLRNAISWGSMQESVLIPDIDMRSSPLQSTRPMYRGSSKKSSAPLIHCDSDGQLLRGELMAGLLLLFFGWDAFWKDGHVGCLASKSAEQSVCVFTAWSVETVKSGGTIRQEFFSQREQNASDLSLGISTFRFLFKRPVLHNI